MIHHVRRINRLRQGYIMKYKYFVEMTGTRITIISNGGESL
jgi:uncharacterized protein YnzC (UPF0291/DUF896 family)